MKLQFKHQKFQADAAKAVVDVFAGQPYLTPTYLMDRGYGQQSVTDDTDFTGWRNERIVPELSDKLILEHLQKVQRTNQIKPSDKLEGRYNLTIEMETGVGKTYTYIKTMYELNKHYGWSKFIVVVPSIAIREGVYKSFQVTQEHFAEEYGKKIRFFIYNSAQLTEIDRFASDSSINVMIILMCRHLTNPLMQMRSWKVAKEQTKMPPLYLENWTVSVLAVQLILLQRQIRF